MIEEDKPLSLQDVYGIANLSEATFGFEFLTASGLPEKGYQIYHEPVLFTAVDEKKGRDIGHLPDFLIVCPTSENTVAVEVTISPDLNSKRKQRKVMRAQEDEHLVEVEIPLSELENLNVNAWSVIEQLAEGQIEIPLSKDKRVGELLIVGKTSLHVKSEEPLSLLEEIYQAPEPAALISSSLSAFL